MTDSCLHLRSALLKFPNPFLCLLILLFEIINRTKNCDGDEGSLVLNLFFSLFSGNVALYLMLQELIQKDVRRYYLGCLNATITLKFYTNS